MNFEELTTPFTYINNEPPGTDCRLPHPAQSARFEYDVPPSLRRQDQQAPDRPHSHRPPHQHAPTLTRDTDPPHDAAPQATLAPHRPSSHQARARKTRLRRRVLKAPSPSGNPHIGVGLVALPLVSEFPTRIAFSSGDSLPRHPAARDANSQSWEIRSPRTLISRDHFPRHQRLPHRVPRHAGVKPQ